MVTSKGSQVRFLRDGDLYDFSLSTLTCGDVSMQIHTPPAAKSQHFNESEIQQALPGRLPVACFPIEGFSWWSGERDDNYVKRYLMPVEENRAMWVDFTKLQRCHLYDFAILSVVQGLNPVVGRQNSTGVSLIKYKNNCPVHGTPFTAARYCADCGYKWPAQNYISTTRHEHAWLDGTFTPKGIRQWYFTSDLRRSIAFAVHSERRIHNMGFVFYRSKFEKPEPTRTTFRSNYGGFEKEPSRSTESSKRRGSSSEKSIEIGAGALLNQGIAEDSVGFEYYSSARPRQIIVEWVWAEKLAEMIDDGQFTMVNSESGPLTGLDLEIGFN